MKFYIDKITHEVHEQLCFCTRHPDIVFLGEFTYPNQAIDEALARGYSRAKECSYCCPMSFY
ncbi:hypothetical protein [Fusobacterium sp. MFO224]|uniref:hypothetical protein n=1 Tax=Fusobacterium sp. MFO224 TaxID=3378070 RepID=UPI0038548BD1